MMSMKPTPAQNIVVFCINPLFPDRVTGGATKHLHNIAVYLGELGHDVTVLSTRQPADDAPFHWHPRVKVWPILPFKQPFPQPYDTPAYNLAEVLHVIGSHLEGADRFYMHDGELLFPYAFAHVPTVVSLRDSVYPETQLGAFHFQGDTLICISEHSRRYYLETAGRFFPGMAERTIVIHNGIDLAHFRPTSPSAILAQLDVDPARDAIVLHPHRPEPSKGLEQTIAVVDRLVHQYGHQNLKVLVPRWLDVGQSAEVRAYSASTMEKICARRLDAHFVFHEWLPQAWMPQLYSLGAVTLALGHFVESFGNSVYESLGCGTPAIASRVATHRELLPEHLIDTVHFGDDDCAAALADTILRERRRTSAATLAYLRTHFSVEKQLNGYARVILGARLRKPLTYRWRPLTAATRYRLAGWCYLWNGGIYHDFLATHRREEALRRCVERFPDGFGVAEAAIVGVGAPSLEQWRREGYIVPI